MNISCVAYMFSIKPKTLHYWYKHELSGYDQEVASGAWGNKKVAVKVDEGTGEVLEEKPVHIAKVENMGSHMTIDEKQIGKKMYTVMTNAQNGKIALLAPTMKGDELTKVIGLVGEKIAAVKSVSCDMSPTYKKFCRETFINADVVVDKFHVVKHVMDGLQQVRRNIKSTCIEEIKQETEKDNQDNKAADSNTTDNKAADNKAADSKTADSKTAEGNNKKKKIIKKNSKRRNDKTANDKTANDKTANDKTENGKTENGKTANDKTANGITENDKTENGKTANGITEGEKTEEEKTEEEKWTEIEMIERSRYILCKLEAEWDNDEKEIMGKLFKRHPILEKAYGLSQRLRAWYQKKNMGRHININEIELHQWCEDADMSKIKEFRGVGKMIEKHSNEIMNYFKEGQTNAKAENMNGKIQRFLANNFGIKDRDFFLYRLAKYFS